MPQTKLSAILNNCALHAITPEIKREIMALGVGNYDNGHGKAYEGLKEHFATFYGFEPKQFTWKQFSKILENFNAFDTQIVMGPVLRAFMKEQMLQNKDMTAQYAVGNDFQNNLEQYIEAATSLDQQGRYDSVSPDQLSTFVSGPLGISLTFHTNEGTVNSIQAPSEIASVTMYHEGGIEGAGSGGHWERTKDPKGRVDFQEQPSEQLNAFIPIIHESGLKETTEYGFELLKKYVQAAGKDLKEEPLMEEIAPLVLTAQQIAAYLNKVNYLSKETATKLLGDQASLTPDTKSFIEKHEPNKLGQQKDWEDLVSGKKNTDKKEEIETLERLKKPVNVELSSLKNQIATQGNRQRLEAVKLNTLEKNEYIQMVQKDGLLIKNIPKSYILKNREVYTKEIALKAVEKNGLALKFISMSDVMGNSINNYILIASTAINKNILAFRFIDPAFKKKFPEKYHEVLQDVLNVLEKTKNPIHRAPIFETLVKGDGMLLAQIKPADFNYLSSKKLYIPLVSEAVKQDGLALGAVNSRFADDLNNAEDYKNIALLAIEQNSEALSKVNSEYIANNMQAYEEIVLKAVGKDASALALINSQFYDSRTPGGYEQYKNIVLAGLNKDPKETCKHLKWEDKYINEYIKKAPAEIRGAIILEIAKQEPQFVNYLTKEDYSHLHQKGSIDTIVQAVKGNEEAKSKIEKLEQDYQSGLKNDNEQHKLLQEKLLAKNTYLEMVKKDGLDIKNIPEQYIKDNKADFAEIADSAVKQNGLALENIPRSSIEQIVAYFNIAEKAVMQNVEALKFIEPVAIKTSLATKNFYINIVLEALKNNSKASEFINWAAIDSPKFRVPIIQEMVKQDGLLLVKISQQDFAYLSPNDYKLYAAIVSDGVKQNGLALKHVKPLFITKCPETYKKIALEGIAQNSKALFEVSRDYIKDNMASYQNMVLKAVEKEASALGLINSQLYDQKTPEDYKKYKEILFAAIKNNAEEACQHIKWDYLKTAPFEIRAVIIEELVKQDPLLIQHMTVKDFSYFSAKGLLAPIAKIVVKNTVATNFIATLNKGHEDANVIINTCIQQIDDLKIDYSSVNSSVEKIEQQRKALIRQLTNLPLMKKLTQALEDLNIEKGQSPVLKAFNKKSTDINNTAKEQKELFIQEQKNQELQQQKLLEEQQRKLLEEKEQHKLDQILVAGKFINNIVDQINNHPVDFSKAKTIEEIKLIENALIEEVHKLITERSQPIKDSLEILTVNVIKDYPPLNEAISNKIDTIKKAALGQQSNITQAKKEQDEQLKQVEIERQRQQQEEQNRLQEQQRQLQEQQRKMQLEQQQRQIQEKQNAEQIIKSYVKRIENINLDFSSAKTSERVEEIELQLITETKEIIKNKTDLSEALKTLKVGESPLIKEAISTKIKQIQSTAQGLGKEIKEQVRLEEQRRQEEEQKKREEQQKVEVTKSTIEQIKKFPVDFKNATTIALIEKTQEALVKELNKIAPNKTVQSPEINQALSTKIQEIELTAQQHSQIINERVEQEEQKRQEEQRKLEEQQRKLEEQKKVGAESVIADYVVQIQALTIDFSEAKTKELIEEQKLGLLEKLGQITLAKEELSQALGFLKLDNESSGINNAISMKEKEIKTAAQQREQIIEPDTANKPKDPTEERKAERRKDTILIATKGLEDIIANLKTAIGAVDKHHFTEAHDTCCELLEGLISAKDEYLRDLSHIDRSAIEINKSFEEKCIKLITDAAPLLKKDLGWGDYLANLLRSIANVLVKAITFGKSSSFFPLATSASLIATQKAKGELAEIKPKEEGEIQSNEEGPKFN